LAVLKGELSLAEAARRHAVSSATVGNWRTPPCQHELRHSTPINH
jgi:hypothetical protein